MAMDKPSKPNIPLHDRWWHSAPCGLIINFRDLDSLFHIFTHRLNLKLYQDLKALVFHVLGLPVKYASQHAPNIGGITDVSSFCLLSLLVKPFHHLRPLASQLVQVGISQTMFQGTLASVLASVSMNETIPHVIATHSRDSYSL